MISNDSSIRRLWCATLVACAAVLAIALAAPAQDDTAPPVDAVLTAEDMDNLVAPIALYPDPLIAQVLPASTVPLDIVQAARFQQDQGTDATEPPAGTAWDPSVISLLGFPSVLKMMNDDLDWTQQLGDAVIAQQGDVMDAIQRLRQEAYDAGALQSNEQQEIVIEQNVINVVPADPQVIYVPQYQTVYVANNNNDAAWLGGVVTFGVGVAVGAIIANDRCDWHHHHVYHHGHGYGYGRYRGDVDIDINRNTNINRNVNRDTNRNRNNGRGRDGGGAWKPSDRARSDHKARQNKTAPNRARAGTKPAARPSTGASPSRSANRSSPNRGHGSSRSSAHSNNSPFQGANRGSTTNRNSARGQSSRKRSSSPSRSSSSRSGSGSSPFAGNRSGSSRSSASRSHSSRGKSSRSGGGRSRGGGRRR